MVVIEYQLCMLQVNKLKFYIYSHLEHTCIMSIHVCVGVVQTNINMS